MKVRLITGCVALLGIVMLVGCSDTKGIFGKYSNVIETMLAAQVAGTYIVEVKKDGNILLSETWICTKGDDGKLTGCHKQEEK